MADISLVVEVKQKGVVNAVKGTKALEGNVKLLSDSFKKGDLSQRQYYKGISQLAQAANKSESELRKYANELRKIEKASANAKVAAKAEATAVKAYAQARREATEANARFNAKAKEATAVAKANALEEERLKNKFVEGYTAMNIYTKELNDLAAARKGDLITTDQQKAAVAELNAQMEAGTGVFANAATGMQIVGKGANRTGVLAQQAGYQFGDFAVQVQSGTNPMIAFGQQATQLIGTFSMLAKSTKAIVAFSALGVIVPVITAIAGAFMRTAKGADEASNSVETLEDKIKSLDSTVQDWLTTRRAASMGITVQELLGTQNVQDAQKAVDDARTALNNLLAQTPQNNAGGFSPRAGVEVRLADDLADLFEKQADAKQKLLDAERLLADLERKNAVERFSNFREEAYELSRQLQLQQDIAKFGSDSAQVRATELKNSIDSYNRQIQAQVRSNDLTQTQADILIKLNSELLTSQDSYDTMVRNQEILKEGAQGFLSIWTSITSKIKEAVAAMPTMEPSVAGGRGVSPGATAEGINRYNFAAQLASLETDGKTTSAASGSTGGSASTLSTAAADSLRTYKEALKEVMALEAERTALVEPMARAFTDGFTSMVDGTMKVKDAFKAMALDIVKHLWKIFVVEQMVNSITGAFGIGGGSGMTSIPRNNPLAGLSGAQMLPSFAGGGYTGDGSRSGGMDGQGGYLAMLHPRETVVDHTKNQPTGDTINVVQNFNFQANGDDSVKKLIAQAAPKIAQMTKSSLLDDRRRGGATKAAFG